MVKDLPGTKFIVGLSDLRVDDVDYAGAKATNEAELLQAGFLVPEGIVLTSTAFQHFLQANQIGDDPEQKTILSATMPKDIREALHGGLASIGGNPVAVRSSAIAEDLPGASFAGQYETILNVQGEEALEAAVLQCWASAFSPRVVSYRETRGLPASDMAVLIQKMIPADVAGVAFSADPVSGDREVVVINAVRGLGEQLVSGEATPDEWIVKGEDAHCRQSPEGVVEVDQVMEIAKMVTRVEAHFGTPQDVEWALADGHLYVLQARPITTLSAEEHEMVPIPIDVPQGFWEHDASRFPTPPSYMFKVAADSVVPPSVEHMAEEFGLLVDGLEIKVIGGWPYQRLKPLGGKEPPPVPIPKPLVWLFVRLLPVMRARLKKAREAVRTDKPGGFIRQWYDQWLPELEGEIAELRDMELSKLSDEELLQHFDDVIAFTIRAIKIHTLLNTSVNFILYQFVSTCQELLGWGEAKAFELVSGTSYKSTEPARRLNDLAQMVQERPAIRNLLESIDDHTLDRLADVDGEFAEAFFYYQRNYGYRTIRWGIKDPTLAERPNLVLSLIRDQMKRGFDPEAAKAELAQKRSQKIAAARDILAGDTKLLDRFDRDLERAEMAYPVREDNNFYTFSAPFAFFRYAVLEIGNRLADRGQIADRDDVFFLYKEQACAALLDGSDQKALVRRHKGERAWAEANPGPPYYGEPPPPPAFDYLPPEARVIMESLVWSYEQMMEYEGSRQIQAAGKALSGIAASAGQYTGPVRIILDESEFHKIQPGDVLVCRMTSPVWSVLFPNLGALVTDAGGLLSHPAIIAREYQIPAVVATGDATSLLKDGEMVRVNGVTGRVESII
jgi:phosphohistidine swiveling domain-containing protein